MHYLLTIVDCAPVTEALCADGQLQYTDPTDQEVVRFRLVHLTDGVFRFTTPLADGFVRAYMACMMRALGAPAFQWRLLKVIDADRVGRVTTDA